MAEQNVSLAKTGLALALAASPVLLGLGAAAIGLPGVVTGLVAALIVYGTGAAQLLNTFTPGRKSKFHEFVVDNVANAINAPADLKKGFKNLFNRSAAAPAAEAPAAPEAKAANDAPKP